MKLPLPSWWPRMMHRILQVLLGPLPAHAIDHVFSGSLPLAAAETFTIAALKPVTITFSGAFTAGAGVKLNASGSPAPGARMPWFDVSPRAHATFGIYESRLIYSRENY